MKRRESPQPVTMFEALVLIAGLVFLVGLSFYLFGDQSSPLSDSANLAHYDKEQQR